MTSLLTIRRGKNKCQNVTDRAWEEHPRGSSRQPSYFVRALSLRVFSAPASRQSSGLFHVHMAQSTRMCAGLRCNSMGSRAVGRSLGRAQVAKKNARVQCDLRGASPRDLHGQPEACGKGTAADAQRDF